MPRSVQEKCENSVAGITASGRATTAATIASTVPSTAMFAQLGREHEQAQREEHAELRDPRQALVEGRRSSAGPGSCPTRARARRGRPRGSPSRAGVGAAEGQRGGRQRGDRVEAGGRELGAAEALDRGPADAEPDGEPDAELVHEQQRDVVEAVAGVRDRLDQREHQQHGDGVVEARLALERARQAPAQRRVAQQREDRGAVRGGEHRADQQALLEVEVEQQHRGDAGDQRAQRRRDQRQRDRGPEHGPDLDHARGEAALEQDQGERDDPDRAREVVVAELDPARAVGPDRHPETQEQQQAGHPQLARHERGQQARCEQRSRDEDELSRLTRVGRGLRSCGAAAASCR